MSEEIETLLGVWAVSLSVSSDMYGARRRRFIDTHAFLQRAWRVEDVLPSIFFHNSKYTAANFFFEPCTRDRFRILSPFLEGTFLTRKGELHVSYTGRKKPPTWVSLLTYTLSLLEQN